MTVWKDFHEFWLKVKTPVHFVRYEDLCKQPQKALPEMMKFIFNTDDLTDTRIQKYIDLSIESNPVRVYKPRAGKAHGNKDKFSKELLVWMREQCPQMLKDFGYWDLFNTEEVGELDMNPTWI